MRPQLFSGARGALKINGVVIAYVTDVSVNVQDNVRPIHTFGAPNARSVEPLSTSCSVSIGRVIPVSKADGSSVDTSSLKNGIEPLINQMTIAEDITVSLEDKVTGKSVAIVKNCRFTGRVMSMAAGQIANERINLVGIYDAISDNAPTKLGL